MKSLQDEGTKVWPKLVNAGNHSTIIDDSEDGQYNHYDTGEISDIRKNGAYILHSTTANKWSMNEYRLNELINTTWYYSSNPNSVTINGYFASIDKNSILNGFNISSEENFIIYNNEGYIVNSKFESTDPDDDLITSNSGVIINCRFVFSPKSFVKNVSAKY